MKIAIGIAYFLIAALTGMVIYQAIQINKLTPSGGRRAAASGTNGEGLGSFGDMVDAVKGKLKDIEIKATF